MKSELINSIYDLLALMKAEPKGVDRDLVREGEAVVSVFFDHNFGPAMDGYTELRRELLEKAAIDLAGGATLLKLYRLGILFNSNRLRLFSVLYSEAVPSGTMVGSVSLKAYRAFERHREQPKVVLTEHEMNAAVYYLTSLMAKT